MKCPNCVLGDLQFFMRSELMFRTDDKGRPCGTADVKTNPDQSWMLCDTCNATFGVEGWQADGSGEVILAEAEQASEDTTVELEPEFPPPGTQSFD